MAVATHSPESAVSSALDRIRARFLDGLDMRILNFENDLAVARKGGESAGEALVAIRNEAHKIAGIAASIGLQRTGAEARAIEEQIDRDLAPGAPERLLADIEPRIEAFLDHLEDLLDEDACPGPAGTGAA